MITLHHLPLYHSLVEVQGLLKLLDVRYLGFKDRLEVDDSTIATSQYEVLTVAECQIEDCAVGILAHITNCGQLFEIWL